MRDEHLVLKTRIVIVAFDPVDHVPAIARARRADAVFVDVWQRGDLRDAVAQISENFSTPITRNLGDKLLAIAGRTARVRHERNVSVASVDLRVPAITPVVIPGALGTTVNQDDERILSPRIEIRRLDDPSRDFRTGRSRPGDFLSGLKLE